MDGDLRVLRCVVLLVYCFSVVWWRCACALLCSAHEGRVRDEGVRGRGVEKKWKRVDINPSLPPFPQELENSKQYEISNF